MTDDDALIARAFRGPGSDVAARITLVAYDDAVSDADANHVALAALKSAGRVRVFAGNYSLASPQGSTLWVTVPRSGETYARASGAREDESPKAHPGLVAIEITFKDLLALEDVLRSDLRSAGAILTAQGRPNREHVDGLLQALRNRVAAAPARG